MTAPKKTAKKPEVIEIRDRYTDAVMFSWEADSDVTGLTFGEKLGLAVRKAVEARAYLAGANLAGAYLAGANLAGANLARADLADANLAGANLARADLADANLAGADLAGADLAGANLAGANLARADLADAYLADAYLAGANLARADLADAYLAGAYLARANLAGADLAGANLADAYLADAYLAGAYLAGANLADAKGAELAIARTRILPEGDLIGWKKCKNEVVVKLRIPADAKRSHAFGRKCRAEFADVLDVIGADVGISQHDGRTRYVAGERIAPDSFDDNWQDECSHGVHFYITREEAEAHV